MARVSTARDPRDREAIPHGTLLVVVDDPDVREILQEMLERVGFQVRAAYRGSDALAWMLLDLAMPDMSGDEVCPSTSDAVRASSFCLRVRCASSSEQSVSRALLVARAGLAKCVRPSLVGHGHSQLRPHPRRLRSRGSSASARPGTDGAPSERVHDRSERPHARGALDVRVGSRVWGERHPVPRGEESRSVRSDCREPRGTRIPLRIGNGSK
jgi:hypothetical protein